MATIIEPPALARPIAPSPGLRWTMPAAAGRVPGLDGLRAVSVVLVLGSHFLSVRIPGALGVYVFFVISGFLITRLLFAERKTTGGISLPKFYLRRIVRLYPVVLAFTAGIFILQLAMGRRFDWAEAFSALFYFANYFFVVAKSGQLFDVFWSLSVEEHFYLLLPGLMVLLRSPRLILAAMAVVCGACLAIRLGTAAAHPELLATRWFTYRTECRLDSLAFGVALACLCELDRGRRLLLRLATPAWCALGLVATIGCLLLRDPYFRETLRYSIQGAAIVLVLNYVLFGAGRAASVLERRPFVIVGLLSYSLYLWHYFAAHVLDAAAPHTPHLIRAAILFPVSFVLATVSYYGLERPLIGLRGRLQGRSAGPGRRDMTESGSLRT